MKDIAEAGLEAGVAEASAQLLQRVGRGRMQPEEMAGVLARIRPTLDYQGFDALDIVVEAVVENLKVKQSVLAECETKVNAEAVLARNTVTVSLTQQANELQRPEQFCRMKFFT